MKKSRFVNKAPQNSMRLYAIQKIFPDAKFINVVRDPRPVVASMMKRFDDEGEFTMGFPIANKINFDELSQIEKWASKYKQVTEYIYEFFKKQNIENFLTVEYDAIIRDPEGLLEAIYEHLGVEEYIFPDGFTLKINGSKPVECPEEFRDYLVQKYSESIKILATKYGSYALEWHELVNGKKAEQANGANRLSPVAHP